MTGEGELGWGVIQSEYLVSALSPEILMQCLVPCQFPDWKVCSFLASDPIGLWVLYAWQLPSTSRGVISILFPGVTSFSQPLVSFMFWKKIIICPLSFLLSMCSIIENSQNFINSQINRLEGDGKFRETGVLWIQAVMDLSLCFAPEFSASFIGYRFLKISALIRLWLLFGGWW